MKCQYCGKETELVDSGVIYGKSYGLIYRCCPCDAYVGCHPRTYKPLGTVANKELREWRKKAHSIFDPMWKAKIKRDKCSKLVARNAAYKWLAEQLNLPVEDTHIGMFNVEQCKRVIEICSTYYK